MSKIIKTNIIPEQPTFAKVNTIHELHLEAICVFAAIGFFLDQDTYWKDDVVLRPASEHQLDDANRLINSKYWFNWHYSPRDITFNQALEEYSNLFETILREQTQGKKVILPLSGGLDSRTQATALSALGSDVFSYSYQFKHGYKETKIAEGIAKVCGFNFKSFEIENGYLWDSLDALFDLNHGFSDFTTPRQMAIYDQYQEMGEVFSLGHWGDVLFDSMNLPPLSEDETIEVILKKIVKRGGLDFASTLWQSWGLEGDFRSYLKKRIESLLKTITIKDTNAKLRAFKSLYWAPRWTSANLSIFSSKVPITLPYYDYRLCEFICNIPEAYLKDRQLQIAYIKLKNTQLAGIPWQDQKPFNLNNYHHNKIPYNLPYRINSKLSRTLQAVLGKPYVQRNWELQFLGINNEKQVRYHLLETSLKKWIPEDLISKYYTQFYTQNSIKNAHAINILIVLSQFNQKKCNG